MSGMNSHIHLLIETSLKEKLMKESKEKGISISEFCRTKLKESSQLDRIEEKLDGVLKRV